jgi:hypothetical protein
MSWITGPCTASAYSRALQRCPVDGRCGGSAGAFKPSRTIPSLLADRSLSVISCTITQPSCAAVSRLTLCWSAAPCSPLAVSALIPAYDTTGTACHPRHPSAELLRDSAKRSGRVLPRLWRPWMSPSALPSRRDVRLGPTGRRVSEPSSVLGWVGNRAQVVSQRPWTHRG